MERNAPDSNTNNRANTQRVNDSKSRSETDRIKDETARLLAENLAKSPNLDRIKDETTKKLRNI